MRLVDFVQGTSPDLVPVLVGIVTALKFWPLSEKPPGQLFSNVHGLAIVGQFAAASVADRLGVHQIEMIAWHSDNPRKLNRSVEMSLYVGAEHLGAH